MIGIIAAHVALSACTLVPFAIDTPPPLPIPVDQLVTLKTMQDVVGVTLLQDGKRAPAELVLPQLENRRHTLEYMRVYYPESARGVKGGAMPVAWVYVDEKGKVGEAHLLTSSGHAALDSLSLNVLRIATFRPAVHGDKAVAVWVPMPARVPPYDELIATLEHTDRPLSEAPQEVAYTQKPVLLNRNQVEAAIVRIVHSLSPVVRADNEVFARAQNAGGITTVNIFIDTQGAVQNVVVKKTSGNPDLDVNAVTIARMMRFAPAKNGASPVEV
ncbi:MAG TPA: TonB family protein, partial [Longimicrobiales bacterium]|nr:TonB family protein [Longimicrobiales bacterium]